MIRRFSIVLSAAALAAALCVCAPSATAQGRGSMRGLAPAPHARSSRPFGRPGFGLEGRRGIRNENAFWFPYFYPWGDFDDDYTQPPPPEAPPVPPAAAPAQMSAAPPVPAAPPAAPLLLEKQNGQWVRVPTGNEIPVAAQPVTTETTSGVAAAPSGYVELPQSAAHAAPLPPAVIVYRDGHTEEVAKYMIQGADLYTSSDYYSTGAWTRKIPLSQLDIPASLRLNKERGTKFNLPTSPNEVVIRF